MGTGYADIDNPLFYKENSSMLLGGGKDICEKLRSFIENHYKHWFVDDKHILFNNYDVNKIIQNY